MSRAALLALALLLVPAIAVVGVAASDGAGPDPAPASTSVSNAVGHGSVPLLMPGEPVSRSVTGDAVDVGVSVSVARDEAATRLARYAFEERLEGAQNRTAVLAQGIDAVEDRVASLREREQASWRAVTNGTTTATRLRQSLARTNRVAEELEAWVASINDQPGVSDTLQDRVDILRRDLAPFVGGVRSQLGATLAGEATHEIFVGASPVGVTLTAIDDGIYTRDVYRIDRQSIPAQPLNSLSLLQEIPQRYGLGDQTPDLTSYGNHAYIYDLVIPGGTINAYLDGGSERIYFERRTHQLSALSGGPTAVTTQNGTRMVVNRTYPGGPLRVATIHNETGDPVRSTITIEGVTRSTGADGVLWTLAPHAGRFHVSASTPTGEVNTFVWVVEPTPLQAGS